MVVGLVAHHRQSMVWYILSAAFGSTLGVLMLALVSRELGEQGLCRIVGEKRYDKLRNTMGKRAGLAVALAGLAPPPFPFTSVIAAAGALDYPIWRIGIINFVSRGVRFTVLAVLAMEFGQAVMNIVRSSAFEWGMIIFIAFCAIASGFSIWRWLRKPSNREK
jgi:membrane protein YqaA with SNARE-associated domain